MLEAGQIELNRIETAGRAQLCVPACALLPCCFRVVFPLETLLPRPLFSRLHRHRRPRTRHPSALAASGSAQRNRGRQTTRTGCHPQRHASRARLAVPTALPSAPSMQPQPLPPRPDRGGMMWHLAAVRDHGAAAVLC